MMEFLLVVLFIILAYLLGSISTAVITCRLMGLPDPRREGSENPGATNVLYIGGKKAAAITLFGDAMKGFIPVFGAVLLEFDTLYLALIAMAAFLGHLYPIFFSFKGGKGVATAFGVIVALSLPVALSVIATWLVVVYIFRLSSMGALVSALFTPFYFCHFEESLDLTVMATVMSLLLIWRHRSNIRKIIAGTED